METPLQGYQRAALMSQAHHLSPVAVVGKQGMTPELIAHVDRELSQHELLKIRFADYKAQRREITEQLSRELGATLVQVIGNIGVLYRPAADPADRVVELPVRGAEGESG